MRLEQEKIFPEADLKNRRRFSEEDESEQERDEDQLEKLACVRVQ